MTKTKAIRITASLPAPSGRTFPTATPARSAAWAKTSLSSNEFTSLSFRKCGKEEKDRRRSSVFFHAFVLIRLFSVQPARFRPTRFTARGFDACRFIFLPAALTATRFTCGLSTARRAWQGKCGGQRLRKALPDSGRGLSVRNERRQTDSSSILSATRAINSPFVGFSL